MVQLYNIAPEEQDLLKRHYLRYLKEIKPYEICEISEEESWKNQTDERIHRYWIFDTDNYDIVGFVFMAWQDGFWDIVQFTVFPEFRNKGFGTQAVACIKGMHNGEIRLSVLVKNPAITFWKKFNIKPLAFVSEDGCLVYKL